MFACMCNAILSSLHILGLQYGAMNRNGEKFYIAPEEGRKHRIRRAVDTSELTSGMYTDSAE